MVDIVVNHNGWNGPPDSVDYSKFNPFNQEEYYNTPYCEIDYNDLGDTVSDHTPASTGSGCHLTCDQ